MQLRPVEGVEESRRTSFSSIQRTTSFDLETSNPGFAEYIIEQLGDALYPADRVHRDGLRIRQEIMERPRANFIDPQPLTFCLYDTFVPRSTPGNTGIIALSGKPPFYLELSIQSLATGEIHKERVQTNDRRWTVAVKNYKFRTVGAYTVTIDSVLDSSRCSEDVSPHGSRVIVVNVAETAAIVPFDRRTDYCVGDKMRFQLEGIPPWHVRSVIKKIFGAN
jgi:nucleoporin POM152